MSKNAFDIILETEETNNKGLFVDLYLKPIAVKKNADDSVMSQKEWILSGNSNLVNIPKTDLETASEDIETPVKTTSENEPEKTKKETKTVTETVTTCTSCKKYKRYLMYSFLFYILLFILFLTQKKQ